MLVRQPTARFQARAIDAPDKDLDRLFVCDCLQGVRVPLDSASMLGVEARERAVATST